MNGSIHKPGDEIGGRYVVRGFLGQGGMQEVFLAEDTLLGKQVALKAPKNASAIKRFKRSAVVSARVNHANVAKTLDYVETNVRAYLIEEMIEGVDLGEVLKSSIASFDPQMVARLLHHLAKGVAASHHVGVIHRDLKPSNVMAVGGALLRGVKITDFGIAKMAEEELAEAVEGGEGSLTASQTAIGALPYMAPEMIQSMKDAGLPADVWSLGAMTYELLTGNRPFGVGLRAIPDILSSPLPPLPASVTAKAQFKPIALEIYEIVLRCVQKDPSKRPSADELVSLCEELCYPIAARETGTVSRFDNNWWGFVSADEGGDVFFHVDSVFGDQRPKVGDRVWYARHAGQGADRAFPMLKMRVPRK